MAARTTSTEMTRAAQAAVAGALPEVAVEVGTGRQAVIHLPNGRRLPLDVVGASVVDASRATDLVRHVTSPAIVVGDLITEDGRAVLDAAGVSWLDRRGHLRISNRDVWIDRQVTPLPRHLQRSGGTGPVRGAAAIGVAAGHLIDPERFGGVRAMAGLLGLSPAAVSTARSRLDDAGLLAPGRDGRRALFGALSAAWSPTWTDLARRPRAPSHLLASGTLAAAASGAPIVATHHFPVELYCTDVDRFERIRLRAGPAESLGPEARLAVAPTPLLAIARDPADRSVGGFPVVHPLFIALDLASDPARGGEALVAWDPQGWDRAW